MRRGIRDLLGAGSCSDREKQFALGWGYAIELHRRLLAAALTFYFLFELVVLDVLLDEAWPVPKFRLPLATPICADTVLAFNLTLEFAAFGLGFHLTRPIPILLFPLTLPPAFVSRRAEVVRMN